MCDPEEPSRSLASPESNGDNGPSWGSERAQAQARRGISACYAPTGRCRDQLRGTYMQSQDAYEEARRRVEARLGFYIHLGVYVAVNALLVVLNLRYSPNSYWFPWPLFGWGIGIVFHALGVFVFPSGSPIKDRMIQREMERQMSSKTEGSP